MKSSETPKVSQEVIRELLEYSFKDHGETIPYNNLTVKEKAIVSRSEYDKVIEFVDGLRNIDGDRIMSTRKLVIIYSIAFMVGTVTGKIIYHYLFPNIF